MAPIVVVPIEEKEPEVNLDKLAMVANDEEEVGNSPLFLTQGILLGEEKGNLREVSIQRVAE